MILHIISSDGMFTKDFYSLITDQFTHQDHVFLSGQPSHSNFHSKSPNAPAVVKGRSLKGFLLARRADAIVVHGLVSTNVLLFLFFQPWLHKKCNWMIFGGDIYGVQRELGRTSRLKLRFIEWVRSLTYPRFGFISVLSSGDYEYAQMRYGVTAPFSKVTYPVAATARIESLEEALLESKEMLGRTIRVQVGNSATDTNHHIKALDMLAHFKDEDLRIFLPLNYGNGDYSAYADRVIAHAHSIFGDKVDVLSEQLEGQQYLDVLSGIDIGIFNNDRQQATGNIGQLTLTGSKIFMRSNISMWAHFADLGCHFYEIDTLRDLSFKEFVEYPRDIQAANALIIRNRHRVGTKVQQWGNVFDILAESLQFDNRRIGNGEPN